MSLVSVFNPVKAQILAKVANAKPFNQTVTPANALTFVQMWNNQLAAWLDEVKDMQFKDLETASNTKTSMYAVAYPAILIEFDNVHTDQLGAGVMAYNDLIIRVHIIHQQLDAGDGTLEQNLDVYALQDAVYQALQKFRPPGCVEFIRGNHQLDWNHGNLYHYIVEYGTNFMDTIMVEPIGGITIAGGVVAPVITETYSPSPYIKE